MKYILQYNRNNNLFSITYYNNNLKFEIINNIKLSNII